MGLTQYHDCVLVPAEIASLLTRLPSSDSPQQHQQMNGFSRLIGPGSLDQRGYHHELFLRGRSDLSKLILRASTKKGRSNHEGRHGSAAPVPSTRNPYYEPNFYLMVPSLSNSTAKEINMTRTLITGSTTAEHCFATTDSCGARSSMLVDINSSGEEEQGAISRERKPTYPASAEEVFANGAMTGQVFFHDRTYGDVIGTTSLSPLASSSTRTEDSILSRIAEAWYQCLEEPFYDYCDSN